MSVSFCAAEIPAPGLAAKEDSRYQEEVDKAPGERQAMACAGCLNYSDNGYGWWGVHVYTHLSVDSVWERLQVGNLITSAPGPGDVCIVHALWRQLLALALALYLMSAFSPEISGMDA